MENSKNSLSWKEIHDEYSADNYPPFGGPFTDAQDPFTWLRTHYEVPKRRKVSIPPCKNCGEHENLHFNYDYTEPSMPLCGYLCNECGEHYVDPEYRSKLITEIMRMDQELGLYDDPPEPPQQEQ